MANLTAGADTWLGTGTTNDTIDGLGGDDVLDGALGNDSLRGGTGDDLIAGGEGADTLRGGSGHDVLDAGMGNDYAYGDAGNDIIYGGGGLDRLYGGAGHDFIDGGADNDVIYGGAGSDALYGGDGADTLYDADNSTNYGTIATDRDELFGGEGNDKFYGGYDTMWGEGGHDTFTVRNQGFIYGGLGNDKITVSNTNAALASLLDGGHGNDSLVGGSGNDTLIGGYGRDTLKGGDGNDTYVITFDDSSYDDSSSPGINGDTIYERATGGVDTIYYIRDFKGDGVDDDVDEDGKEIDPILKVGDFKVTLPNNIENAVLDDQIYVNIPTSQSLSYFNAWLTGNKLNNDIRGSNLDDVLDGALGDDTIHAAAGNDTIFAGQGTDSIDGGIGLDLIATRVDFDLRTQSTNVEDVDLLDVATALSATGDDGNNTLTGNRYDNQLTGNAGNDTLDGWFYSPWYAPVSDSLKTTGVDTLIGGTGNDVYRIDSVEDKVVETQTTNGGNDTVEFKGAVATDTYVLPTGVENLKMLGNLKTGVGNHLNNRIIGDGSANILRGGYGNDTLDGGGGIDNFEGGYGDDTYVVDVVTEVIKEISGQGNDWVQSERISLDLNTPNWGGSIENGRLTGSTNLNLTGSTTNNRLEGNKGHNVLDGGDGVDTLVGGLGNDTYYIDTTTDSLIEVANEVDAKGLIKEGWIDTIQSSVDFSLVSLLNFENLSLAPGSTAVNATGNLNDNLIKGNDLANKLEGLAGNDTLDGSAGVDTLIGGTGDDTYRLSNDGDIIIELAGALEGNDTIEISNTFSLLTSGNVNVENLTLLGTTDMNGEGNASANVIIGNSARNILEGLTGNDTLKGGEGEDILIGGVGADTIDLTESLAKKDVVRINAGDSLASVSEADKVIRFDMRNDTLDLVGTKIASNVMGKDGIDAGTIKSHFIINGIISFDDSDSYAAALSVSNANIASVIDYLKNNLNDGSTVAFKMGSDTWLFQDNGATDTLVNLIGISASSVSATSYSSTAIHIE